jgi:hypothetical protein
MLRKKASFRRRREAIKMIVSFFRLITLKKKLKALHKLIMPIVFQQESKQNPAGSKGKLGASISRKKTSKEKREETKYLPLKDQDHKIFQKEKEDKLLRDTNLDKTAITELEAKQKKSGEKKSVEEEKGENRSEGMLFKRVRNKEGHRIEEEEEKKRELEEQLALSMLITHLIRNEKKKLLKHKLKFMQLKQTYNEIVENPTLEILRKLTHTFTINLNCIQKSLQIMKGELLLSMCFIFRL